MLTSVWARIQVPAGPCDEGMLELRRSQRTPTDCLASRRDAQKDRWPLFCSVPKAKILATASFDCFSMIR